MSVITNTISSNIFIVHNSTFLMLRLIAYMEAVFWRTYSLAKATIEKSMQEVIIIDTIKTIQLLSIKYLKPLCIFTLFWEKNKRIIKVSIQPYAMFVRWMASDFRSKEHVCFQCRCSPLIFDHLFI